MHIHNCPACGKQYSAQENVSQVKCPYCGAVNDMPSAVARQSSRWFILNRPDDRKTESKRKILLRAVLWFIALIIIGRILMIACVSVYMANGINPMQLTEFGGMASHWAGTPILKAMLWLIVIAPVAEEVLFRLGLSFKRHTVALWLGLLPVVIGAYLFKCYQWTWLTALVLLGILLAALVVRFTTDEQWARWRSRYIRPAMWVSAIGFGLLHLIAFTNYSWLLVPFMIAVIMSPLLLGCVITYVRVNLGFWWGVLFHVVNNIPVVLVLLAMN